jgi:hypothetical protein
LLRDWRGRRRLSQLDLALEVHDTAGQIAVPVRLRSERGELAFFSTIATFGTAVDVTLAELSIEAFFPADTATAEALRAFADARLSAPAPPDGPGERRAPAPA